MIEELVPATVATVVTRADLDTELFAEEARALGSAEPARRREFETGRACARRALASLGLPAAPVAGGERGEPLWPAGVVGSITHCSGLRACAVARASDVRAIGIDAEPHAPLPPGVLDAVCAPGERRALAAHGAGVCWDRVLFSAKEAVFKAWYPLTGRLLGFEDVDVRLDPAAGTFRARGVGSGGAAGAGALPAQVAGRFAVAGGIVATAVVVDR